MKAGRLLERLTVVHALIWLCCEARLIWLCTIHGSWLAVSVWADKHECTSAALCRANAQTSIKPPAGQIKPVQGLAGSKLPSKKRPASPHSPVQGLAGSKLPLLKRPKVQNPIQDADVGR